MKDDIVAALVADIYEAGIVPDLWPAVLGRISGAIEAFGGLVVHRSGPATSYVATDNNRALAADLLAGGFLDNEWLRRYISGGHLGFVDENTIFGEEDRAAYPIYSQFLWPRGLVSACGAVILVPNGDSLVFGFERTFDTGPFTATEVDLLNGLRPHIARAAMVAGRLKLERARSALDTLAVIGMPAAVVDRSGAVTLHNRHFDLLGPTVRLRGHGRLGLGTRAADRLFGEALEGLDNGETGAAAVRSIPLPGDAGHPACVLHVLPIVRQANDIFSGSHALLVFTPLAPRDGLDATLLRGLFDLTLAEARVARAVVAGQSVDEIASETGTARETVRTHLKRVMSKTGTGRQAELAALLAPLARLPA